MLSFDEAAHAYAWNGRPVPGVTDSLREFKEFREVPGSRLERARKLGTAVHYGCELHSKGVLDWNDLDPVVRPRLEAYLKFLDREAPEILFSEEKLFHPLFEYAGTADLGMIIHGARAIVDIKSGVVYEALAGPQTAAYLAAKNKALELAAPSPDEYKRVRYCTRYALQLRADASYRLIPLTDASDEGMFYSCLSLGRWRAAHHLPHPHGEPA